MRLLKVCMCEFVTTLCKQSYKIVIMTMVGTPDMMKPYRKSVRGLKLATVKNETINGD
jgi:hypothetical protein